MLAPRISSISQSVTMGLEGRPVESFTYPGAAHWFAEPGRLNYDEHHAEAAWTRTIEFLHRS